MLGMQGLGKPGVQQVGVYQGPKAPRQVNANTGSTAGTARWRGIGAVLFHPLPPYINQYVPKVKVPEAILDGHMESWGNTSIWAPVEDQFTKYIYPYPADDEVVDSREFRNPNGPPASEFHMIWQDHSCHIACWTDTNSYIHAIRSPKIECIVLQCIWMENDVLYADIVLPCSTNVEERDILGFGAEYAFTVYHEPIIQPVGESKSDYGIVVEVAKKLEKYGGRYEGLVNKLTGGKTDEEWCKAGFDASKIDTLETGITWDQLKEKGYWTAPVATDWYNDTRGLNGFYTDPEKNPIQLPSGKLEFYSERLKENFPDDEERGPYPKYQPGGPGMFHDESLVVEDGAERCKTYKLVMQAQHVRWRLQSQGDDVPWTREIPTCKILVDGYRYEPVWINPQDAETRGIKHGDLVKVWNDRSTELGAAYVTHRIIPGAVHMDHGSRLDYISNAEEDYADRGKKWVNRSGTCNQLSPYPGLSRNAPGMVASSYLVNVDKLDPSEMQEWRDKYPESFSRAYDPDYGPLSTDEWVVKEGKQ